MNTPDPTAALHALRRRFPHWAFLYNPLTGRWFALRSNATTLVASTPEQLADYIQHIQPSRPPAQNTGNRLRTTQRPANHPTTTDASTDPLMSLIKQHAHRLLHRARTLLAKLRQPPTPEDTPPYGRF